MARPAPTSPKPITPPTSPGHAALIANRDDNQRAFDLAQVQLQRGAISFPDLLTTQRNLEEAKAQLAAADQALVDDQVAVFQSLGGGWQEHSRGTAINE